MAIDIRKGSHIVSFPSKIASMMGQFGHVYNLLLSADTDNGTLSAKGDYVDFDQYEQDTVTANAVEVTVRGKGADGLWLVEVTKLPATTVLYVYNGPVSEYEKKSLQDESLFFNKADEVAQGAELKLGDMFSLSDNAFTGTVADGAVAKYSAGKYAI